MDGALVRPQAVNGDDSIVPLLLLVSHFFCMCLHMDRCTCKVCVCVCVRMWRLEFDLGGHSSSIFHLVFVCLFVFIIIIFLYEVSLTGLEFTLWTRLSLNLQRLTCLWLPDLRIKGMRHDVKPTFCF